MNRAIALVIAASIALLGCSGAMVNRTRPNADYSNDLYTCQLEASRTYPVVMQTNPANGTISENCYAAGNQINCNGTFSPPLDVSAGVDINATNRALAQFSCMGAKGWHWESDASAAKQQQRQSDIGPVVSRDDDRYRLGYVVGYDAGKAIQRFAGLVDNAPLIGGIDDGFHGQIVIPPADLAKLRTSFTEQIDHGGATNAGRPQWSAHPIVPSITSESPLRTQYSYMVGVDIATRLAYVAEFIDVGTLKVALVDTLAGHPVISEDEAAARRRVLHDLLQERSKRQ